jgi:antimicrobial peptide system SdpB family protein
MTAFKSPWTNAYGVSRTMLACATLLTLLGNPADTLFRPLGSTNEEALAPIAFAHASMFHLIGMEHLLLGKAVAVAVLCLAACGWRPRLTGILHWWIAASFAASAVLLDGGDQANAVLTLLLVPVTLTDSRKWHWDPPPPVSPGSRAAVVAKSCLTMIGFQMAVIYFVASTSKFSAPEWANGTALYYWFTQPVFGLNSALGRFVNPLLANRFFVVPATWSVLALEVTLAGLVFATPGRRRKWLVVAIAFHLGIVLVHGLFSFGVTMIAGLWLYLRQPDSPLRLPTWSLVWSGRSARNLVGIAPVSEVMLRNLTGEVAK